MTPDELLKHVLRGRLLLVGEYRGSRAERKQHVDHKTGEAIGYVQAIHLLECGCRGNLDRAMIYERLPETVDTKDPGQFELERGRLFVFFVSSIKNERGQVIAFASERKAERIDLEEGSGAAACGAPSGAAQVGAPNLV